MNEDTSRRGGRCERDWEARAVEIWRAECNPGYGGTPHADYLRAMIHLGREMATDAHRAEAADCAKIMGEKESAWRDRVRALELKAEALEELRANAADARAEEIAEKCKAALDRVPTSASPAGLFIQEGLADAIAIARSFIAKPKTREQVLEEALREIRDAMYGPGTVSPKKIARRALEWKP